MKKVQKKLLIFVIIFAIIFIVIGRNYPSNDKKLETNSTQSTGSNIKKMTTAIEALELAYKDAQSIIEEPLFESLQSTDDTTTSQTINEGLDGKRSAWNVIFGTKDGTMIVHCNIRNGESSISYVDENKEGLLSKSEYHVSDLKIDSSEVIKKAIKEKNIKPGNPDIEDDWIVGYHFTVYGALYDPNSYDKVMVMRVTGISPNSPNEDNDSLRANVFFDAKTGKILSASEQTGYDENGRTTWKEF